jgi:hypothetical protein
MWRGAVRSSIKGKRGQKFIREMIEALEAMPEKKLEASVLVSETGCCAMGAVALHRGADVSGVEPTDRDAVAEAMGIAGALAAEVAFENDQDFGYHNLTPEQRWKHMHKWAKGNLRTVKA